MEYEYLSFTCQIWLIYLFDKTHMFHISASVLLYVYIHFDNIKNKIDDNQNLIIFYFFTVYNKKIFLFIKFLLKQLILKTTTS